MSKEAVVEPEYFSQFEVKKQELTQIKENLNKLVDPKKLKLSLFSRTAKYWYPIPAWQKILLGTVLAALTVVGILCNLPVMIALSAFSLFAYLGSCFFLHNHESQQEESTTFLKNAVEHLVPTLETLILSLDALHQNLALKLEQFQQEIEKLNGSLTKLKEQLTTSEKQNEELQSIIQGLKHSEGDLKERVSILNDKSDKQTAFLAENEIKLQKAIENYETIFRELNEKKQELEHTKKEFDKRIEELKSINHELGSAFESYKKIVDQDMEKTKAEKTSLKNLLDDTTKDHTLVLEKMKETEQNLRDTSQSYENTAKKLRLLVDERTQLLKGLQNFEKNTAELSPTSAAKSGFFSQSIAEGAGNGNKSATPTFLPPPTPPH